MSIPTFGVVLPAIGAFVDPGVERSLVTEAERLGYTRIWYGDHVVIPDYAAPLMTGDWLDPVARCLVGAGATSRIGFATDVLVAAYRHPLVLAKIAATADRLTGGRVALGFGVGYLRGEFEALGAPPYAERGRVTDEYLDVMTTVWNAAGQPVSYDGRYVRFTDVHVGPPPLSAPMPLFVGGNSPAALRRAARWGTGWHPLFPTPDGYAAGRAEIVAARGGAGGFTFSYSCGITRLIDSADGPYPVLSWAEVEGVPADFGYAPPMPTDENGRPRFMGTPAQVRADVAAYAEAGVQHFALRFSNGAPGETPEDAAEQMRRFAAEVMAAPDQS